MLLIKSKNMLNISISVFFANKHFWHSSQSFLNLEIKISPTYDTGCKSNLLLKVILFSTTEILQDNNSFSFSCTFSCTLLIYRQIKNASIGPNNELHRLHNFLHSMQIFVLFLLPGAHTIVWFLFVLN
jgi:hypothetical protein